MASGMSYDTYTAAVYPTYTHVPRWLPPSTYATPLLRLLPAEKWARILANICTQAKLLHSYVAVSSQVVYIGRGGKVPMVASVLYISPP